MKDRYWIEVGYMTNKIWAVVCEYRWWGFDSEAEAIHHCKILNLEYEAERYSKLAREYAAMRFKVHNGVILNYGEWLDRSKYYFNLAVKAQQQLNELYKTRI